MQECRCNKFLLLEYHPGVFINKWSCCEGKEKTTPGCKESFAAQERNSYQGGELFTLIKITTASNNLLDYNVSTWVLQSKLYYSVSHGE